MMDSKGNSNSDAIKELIECICQLENADMGGCASSVEER